MLHLRTLILAMLLADVASMRMPNALQQRADPAAVAASLGFELPPELKEQLSTLLSEENLPKLLEEVPEEKREVIEKFAPLVTKGAVPIIETVMGEMTPDQQEKIKEVVEAVISNDPSTDPSRLVEELIEDVGAAIQENLDDPEFIGKLVGTIAQDGDSLGETLRLLLGPDQAGLVGPLIDFMSLGGTPVFENLDSIRKTGGDGNLMDGPLRTLFLLSNMLAYSTSLGEDGTTFGPEAVEGKKAYAVVDANLKEKPGLKWLVPEQWVEGMTLICAALKLKLTRLEMQEDILLEPEEPEGDEEPGVAEEPGAVLYTVRLSLETTGESSKRSVMIHSVRTGVGAKQGAGVNDLYLLMGLYETRIRESVGRYSSLADFVFVLGQKIARWDWLMKKIGEDSNPLVEKVAGWDEKRKSLRVRLGAGIKNTISAEELSDEKDCVHVYTGISLGGSIARAKAMAAKFECEECPVVALTINAPNIYKVVHKMELVPEDGRPWFERWFSEPVLKQKADLFAGFVNFVAQHDLFWKLDDPLPGSKTCMYMHTAELAGCRGVTDLGSVYRAVWSALWKCKREYGAVPEGEDGTLASCVMDRVAPAIQCALQEHAFALSGQIGDMREMLAGESGLESFNTAAFFTDIVNTFSDFTQVQRKEGIDWLKKQTGYTATVPLAGVEAQEREAERKAAMDEIQIWLSQERNLLKDKFNKLEDDLEKELKNLPSCTGCQAEWCKEKDIRQHRCCAADDSGACYMKANYTETRTLCHEDGKETCAGFGRWVRNRGRRCMCAKGHCWDGSGCAVDYHVDKRKALTQQLKDLKHDEKLQLKNRDYLANEKRAAYEAKLVKKVKRNFHFRKIVTDAKPDPAVNAKW
eukprot:CAMPEP_0115190144 /NCGR_PEP_ID=MMETSP0270-20121206/11875_1 /TAXON_ID=71861 /ORGANISM="Scrippsiella trochoidea, Strain CCMP3099" /LENGTH=863 /DNA_ID=CAMNT_0002603349 /DNA_START=62 /DNA_END=2650 /DNA_ORIENTATION=+